MCLFCGELGGGRSAGVGQTLTGVPALPEGSSQCTKRKSSSNVRREMLSTKTNLNTEETEVSNFKNKDSGLGSLFA